MVDRQFSLVLCIMGCVWLALSAVSAAWADDAPAAASAGGLDEIVVTAQRRSESGQRVPMSISAFSGEALENRGIVSTEDLAKITPGLQFGSASLGRNELYLRGIGSDRFDAGVESSSGVFIDDVYQPRFSNLLFDLLDADRVEVLKARCTEETPSGARSRFTSPCPPTNPT